MARPVESGVSPYDGIMTSWYGWAQRKLEPGQCVHCGGHNGSHMRWCSPNGPQFPARRREYLSYREGDPRLFKAHARLDAYRLARKLRK